MTPTKEQVDAALAWATLESDTLISEAYAQVLRAAARPDFQSPLYTFVERQHDGALTILAAALASAQEELAEAKRLLGEAVPFLESASDVEAVGGPDDPCGVNMCHALIEQIAAMSAQRKEGA